MRSRTRRLSWLLLAVLLAVPGSAAAASPNQVDPSTMTPPLNPDWAPWTCTDTGAGPVCRGFLEESWAGDDTGLSCDGAPIYTWGSFDSEAVRWHLPDGRATRTQFHQSITERWTLAPDGSGPAARVMGRFTEHYVYPVPGDRATRVERWTGMDWNVTAPGYGVVFHDTGYVRYEPGTGHVPEVVHGPDDSGPGDLDRVLPAVCEALGA